MICNLNLNTILRFLVTKKSVREHPKLLLDKHRARMQKEWRDSGVEVEETELDQALKEINEKWEAAGEQDILLVNNKKKTEENNDERGGPKEHGIRHISNSFGNHFTSVAWFADDLILLRRLILAFASGRWLWWPERCSFCFFGLFVVFVDGADSSAHTTLVEELASTLLEGVVTVVVQLLGTFLFCPGKVVSVSLTERH